MSQATTSNIAVQKPDDTVTPGSFRELLAALEGQTELEAVSLVTASLKRHIFDKQQRARLCKYLLKNQFLNAASAVIGSIEQPEPEHRCIMAQIAYREKRYSDAITIWSKDDQKPLSIRDHFSLIDALEQTGKKNSLLRETDLLTSRGLTSEQKLQRLCRILLRQERPNKAIQFIENYGLIEHTETYLLLANAYRVSGNYIASLEIINKIKLNKNTTNRQQLQRLLHGEIQTQWDATNYEAVVDCCNNLIKKFPEHFQAYHYRLRALRNLGKHSSLLSLYEEIYDRFGANHPNITLGYSKALDFKGQSTKAVSILEQACTSSNKLLPELLKIYLRHGHFDKFIDSVKTEEINQYDQLTILTDYFILSARLGLYEKLPDLLNTLGMIKPNNIIEHKAYIECQNHLIQVHQILTTSTVDTSRLLSHDRRIALVNQLEKLKKPDTKPTQIINRSSWDELIQSKYVTNSNQLKMVSHTVDNYLNSLQACKNLLLDTYEQPAHARSLASIIKERVVKKIPTSLIRLGDGEGAFLSYPEYVRENQHDDQKYVQSVWWGRDAFEQNLASKKEETINIFNRAIKNADIIGVPPVRRLLQPFGNLISEKKEVSSPARRILGVINSIDLFDRYSTVFTSCHVHTDLELWDGYFEILNEIDELHLITCHNHLGDFIRQRFGIDSVVIHNIPAEARYANLFGKESNNSHFPDAFDALKKAIPAIAEGRLFLVGAGFLGKIYCDLIKRNGGIALDIGSMMDRWAGFGQTRAARYDLDHNFEGLKYTDREKTKIELPSGDQPVATNHYRNRLLPIEHIETETILCQFLVSGHPRSGTGYAASLFSALGYNLGHEKLESHGISSWINAVNDRNFPLFPGDVESNKCSRDQLAVKHLIMVVRDPQHVIPSIMIENRNNLSYRFRRYHILNQCGIDLEDCNTAVECAVTSYLCWLQILEQQQPDCTLHIETIEPETRSFLEKAGYSLPVVETAAHELKRNATISRYGIEKPTLDSESLATIDPSLKVRLAEFCDKHGYELAAGIE